MPNLCVVNLGCKVNRIEADTITADLVAQGAQLAEPTNANVVLINTCTVTAEAASKARKAVRRALAGEHLIKVIVTGCAAAIDTKQLQAIGDKVLVEPDKIVASKQAASLLGLLDDTNHNAALSVRFGKDYRLRPGIKVQDGCNTRCTYCIVPKARGTARSVPLEQVLSDAERLLAAGARELVLSGINLGKYQYADNGFLDLLKALQPLIKQARPARLRLSSLEPDDISNELVEYLAQNQTQICAHLHLPLQSGSSRILELMRRPYDAKDYLKCVELLRDKIPTIALSTDVIVGFPTESEADFEATMALCKQSEFSRIHAFRFSAREGTSAATMPSQVAPQVKKERAQVLAKLAAKLTTNDQQKRNSSSEQILIVRPGEGLSASYHEVEVAETIKAGELIEMRLVARSDKLIGSIM